ncbi:unnamed protein product [Brachionus calyciflorus]|uniref:PPPDE domain-containing protein n=1 Tax=Brachionus calyciflorus TaxID=104777 RepID=A0A813U407_9BILA|nr:unnamed protein product [Brachionus calyciflorus]
MALKKIFFEYLPDYSKAPFNAIFNLFKEDPIRNNDVSAWIRMDDFKEKKAIQSNLNDQNCFFDQTQVEIQLLGRELHQASTNNFIHPAWLIIFIDHPINEYAIVEYGKNGISVYIFKKELEMSLFQVSSTMIGDSNKIIAQFEYSTTKTWGEILDKIYRMQVKYSPETYDVITRNCNDFAEDLGEFLLNNSNFKIDFYKSWYYYVYMHPNKVMYPLSDLVEMHLSYNAN